MSRVRLPEDRFQVVYPLGLWFQRPLASLSGESATSYSDIAGRLRIIRESCSRLRMGSTVPDSMQHAAAGEQAHYRVVIPSARDCYARSPITLDIIVLQLSCACGE